MAEYDELCCNICELIDQCCDLYDTCKQRRSHSSDPNAEHEAEAANNVSLRNVSPSGTSPAVIT